MYKKAYCVKKHILLLVICACITIAETSINIDVLRKMEVMDAHYYRLPEKEIRLSNIQILNPYKNYPYFYKGQPHCHSTRSDGKLKPRKVLETYRDYGYDFVILTDHDKIKKTFLGIPIGMKWAPYYKIFIDPGVSGITYVPGEEGGKGTRTHFLELGLTDESGRPGDEFDLETWVHWVEYQGGMAGAPHPLANGHVYTTEELYMIPWLRAIELKNNENDPLEFIDRHLVLWDGLLRADRVRWCLCVDDAHKKADINSTGFVVVNSELDYAHKWDIIFNMRRGNFFSILLSSNTLQYPVFERITTSSLIGMIKVTFSHAQMIRIIGRDGLLEEHTGFFESQQNTITHSVDGSEGYIRFEIEDGNGTVAFSQPLFIYGNSVEDCIPFDYTQLEVENYGLTSVSNALFGDDWDFPSVFDNWVIKSGSAILERFGPDEEGARKALAIIQYYKMTHKCYVTRPWPGMEYYLVNGQAPEGTFPNEDALPFDYNSIEAKLVTNPYTGEISWKIIEGDEWLLDFKDSEIMAKRALEIIKRHKFTRICYVGRGNPGPNMVYFRR